MSTIRAFMDKHFLHFNSRETVDAARAYEAHIDAGGKMLVALAGAMSTAKIGQILSRMIRAGKVHAVSCTGANLEEDLFNLLAYNDYEIIKDWRALSAQDEADLYARGFNRVTDTCIPETVMRNLEARLLERWKSACEKGERKFESEYLADLFRDGKMEQFYQIGAENSWLLAAWEKGIPVYSPGWEDSTTGNMFAAGVLRGAVRQTVVFFA
jgi:deoxyhypusine synthase